MDPSAGHWIGYCENGNAESGVSGVIRSNKNEYIGGSLVATNAAEKMKRENGLRWFGHVERSR